VSYVSALAIYFIIWWLTLFLVLPVGVRSQAESETVVPGTDPGAPVRTHLGLKLAANTILSGVVFGVLYLVTNVLGFGIEDLVRLIVPE
jgi:predicted secreted protein